MSVLGELGVLQKLMLHGEVGGGKGRCMVQFFCACEGGSPALPNDWLLLS